VCRCEEELGRRSVSAGKGREAAVEVHLCSALIPDKRSRPRSGGPRGAFVSTTPTRAPVICASCVRAPPCVIDDTVALLSFVLFDVLSSGARSIVLSRRSLAVSVPRVQGGGFDAAEGGCHLAHRQGDGRKAGARCGAYVSSNPTSEKSSELVAGACAPCAAVGGEQSEPATIAVGADSARRSRSCAMTALRTVRVADRRSHTLGRSRRC